MVVALDLPIINLDLFRDNQDSATSYIEAIKAADALKKYGALLLKDSRVNEEHNHAFLDMMEEYYSQPADIKMKDARPEYAFQVGVTPEFTEEPSCMTREECLEILNALPEGDKPTQWKGPDPKWRFFWRHGEAKTVAYQDLNMAAVIPESFRPKWEPLMNSWSTSMHNAVETVCHMLGIGLGLKNESALVEMSQGGPHLLAPTGSDLSRFNKVGTVLAGFHYDLNLLTIHGKSRFPGLHIWAKNTGSKMAVHVPDGCLLVQAGKQLEILTGGEILAGYHEVVVTEGTVKAIEKAKSENRPLWRVSSTFFHHISSDQVLRPLPPLDKQEAVKKYPQQICGDYVRLELNSIKLR